MGFETKVLEKIEPFTEDSYVEFIFDTLIVDNINPATAEAISDVLSREFNVTVKISKCGNSDAFGFKFIPNPKHT